MQIINAKINFENKTKFESLKNIGNCNEKILTFIKQQSKMEIMFKAYIKHQQIYLLNNV